MARSHPRHSKRSLRLEKGFFYSFNVQGDRRCAALSRSVQRPKGARSTDGLGMGQCANLIDEGFRVGRIAEGLAASNSFHQQTVRGVNHQLLFDLSQPRDEFFFSLALLGAEMDAALHVCKVLDYFSTIERASVNDS